MSSSSSLDPEQIAVLRKAVSAMRDAPDSVPDFFRDFLIEWGATIPAASSSSSKPSKASAAAAAREDKDEDDALLDDDDADPEVVAPESDPAQPMGPPVAPDLTEAETDALMDVKAAAAEALANGDLDAAIAKFTEVLMKAPSPLVYAKRADAYVKQRKCVSAVRDCDAALEMNPDSAKALKTRGLARRYLGHWTRAQLDLARGQSIDYDEQTAATQKLVQGKFDKARSCTVCIQTFFARRAARFQRSIASVPFID